MKRKVFVILILALTAFCCIGAASAGLFDFLGSGESGGNNTTVSIVNETFNIPDGFRETGSVENDNWTRKIYTNDDNKTITIDAELTDFTELQTPGLGSWENKTIGERNGIYNAHTFKFKHGYYDITIRAPDDGILEQVVG